MKILINAYYYGLIMSKEFKDAYPSIFQSNYYHEDDPEFRTNSEVIAAVEEFGVDKAGDVVVAEIPDSATDYYIVEDGGESTESLLYVVDGKIRKW